MHSFWIKVSNNLAFEQKIREKKKMNACFFVTWHWCRFSSHFKYETELESKCGSWTWIAWSWAQQRLALWIWSCDCAGYKSGQDRVDVGQGWFEVTVWDLLIQVTASGELGHAPDLTPTSKTNHRLLFISLLKVPNHRRWSGSLTHWKSNQDDLSSMCCVWWFSLCVCSSQDRLQSLVFGLLRQRKLDFLDIYSEEMVRAAKNVVRQVRHVTDTRDGDQSRSDCLSLSLFPAVCCEVRVADQWDRCRRCQVSYEHMYSV